MQLTSVDLPEPFGPIRPSRSPDATESEIDPTGSTLIFSTIFGGSGTESQYAAGGIAIDASGNAYIAGTTYSHDFPTKNPLQTFRGMYDNAFISKISSDGSTLIYSTLLGGSVSLGPDADEGDEATGIAVDGQGMAT